jgi:hypothetical protein
VPLWVLVSALASELLALVLELLAPASVLLAPASGVSVAGKRNYGPHFSQKFQNGFEHRPCWSRQAHLTNLDIDQDSTASRICKCNSCPRFAQRFQNAMEQIPD